MNVNTIDWIFLLDVFVCWSLSVEREMKEYPLWEQE